MGFNLGCASYACERKQSLLCRPANRAGLTSLVVVTSGERELRRSREESSGRTVSGVELHRRARTIFQGGKLSV